MVKETEELILTRCLVCAWFGCSEESNYHNRDKETIKFIEKARNKQGWKYNYENTVYIRSKDKVTIKCEEHGEFKQIPYDHSSGRGCPICGGSAPSDTESFIKKANIVHNNRYIYSKVDYKNKRTKVTITCKLHGDFIQIPGNHLYGHGCPMCGWITFNTESFINKVNTVHNNRYTYFKVDYKNNYTKVTITCKLHGDFIQRPCSHLYGNGCPICGGTAPLDTKSFIKKANIVHNNRYIYSKVDYKNIKTKVIITCKQHGNFLQTPHSHLSGQGCSKCQVSKGELTINTYLIKNKISFESQYKITGYKYRYDCFIPFINTLIEYDGEGPHFSWNNFHTHKQAKKQGISPQQIHEYRKTSDIKKTKLALEHGYKIVRIPYTECEQVDTILQGILENPRNLIVNSENAQVNSIYKAHVDLINQYKK